jgi:hypothetical protein
MGTLIAFFGILKALILIANGQRIVLDVASDDRGLFYENSCTFSQSASEFQEEGCPLVPPADENLLDSHTGFWTTCHGTPSSCELFFDVGQLPSVKNITIGAYFQGHVSFSIWAKFSADEDEEWDLQSIFNYHDETHPTYSISTKLEPTNYHVMKVT